MNDFLSVLPLSWASLGTAIICGFIIGIERQLRGKPVGIRTSTLIVLGTYIFIAVSMSVMTEASDPSRIIGQIITGVGFLGAGVMLTKNGTVVGVTSAATIWALAAIGICIGVGYNFIALKLACIILFILVGVDLLENYSQLLSRGVHNRIGKWKNENKNSCSDSESDVGSDCKTDTDYES